MSTHAACVLAFSCCDDEILTVSRGADTDDRNLPGGKVEAGELAIEAALRELLEETGIKLTPADVADECFIAPGHSGKEVETFIATICKQLPLTSSKEGLATWSSQASLYKGAFAPYNRALLEEFSIKDAPAPKCKCERK